MNDVEHTQCDYMYIQLVCHVDMPEYSGVYSAIENILRSILVMRSMVMGMVTE